MQVLALPSAQWLLRLHATLVLALACLSAVFPVYPSSEQRDNGNSFSVESCCNLNLADAPHATGYGLAADAAASTDPNLTFSLPIDTAKALDLSPREILDNAESALERFRAFRFESDLFLGLDADMDDRIIHRSGALVRKMSTLISELREANNGAALEEALSEQAGDVRAGGVRLFLAASRLHLLMEEQDRCGLRNRGLLLSAVETLALELEENSVHGEQPVPALHYFFFPNHLPNIVPRDGGWLTLVGPDLWRNGTPHIAVVDQHRRKVTGPLEVRQAGTAHATAVRIDPKWIMANAGRCLWLKVGDDATSSIDWRTRPNSISGRSLPVCIPLSFGTSYKIAGFLEYRSPTRTRLHKARSMLFENASCTEDKQVSGTLEWELNPGGWLTDMGESALYEAGASSIECEISESRIMCQGQLGPATCGQDMRSGDERSLLLEQSEWEHIFTPMEEYPEEETHHSWSLSQSIDLDQLPTHVNLTIPREEPSDETTIWYELIIVNGGQQHTLFVSPKKTLTGKERISHVVGHDRITAEFTAEPDAPDATIDISIESTACRY